MRDVEELRAEVEKIKERNSRVEADKAWEVSVARTIILTIITYVVATLALWVIGNSSPFVNALVPSLGFLLSVQSLPFVKGWWVKNYLRNRKV
jgi:preprotein translocase subunit SecF